MYNYAIFKKYVLFSHSTQTGLFQGQYQVPEIETMQIPKSFILECAEKIKKMEVIMAGLLGHIQKDTVIDVKIPKHKSDKKTIWAITHGTVIDGHWGHTITYVKEETAKKALKFFNGKLANNHWTQKAKIDDVEQIKVHKE